VTGDFDIGLGGIPDPFAQAVGEAVPAPAPRPASPSASRSRRRALRLAAACGAGLYEAAGVAFFKTRPDLSTAQTALVALELALPLALGTIVLVLAAKGGRLGLGEPTIRLAAWVIGAPVLFGLVTVAFFPTDLVGEAFWSRTETCFLVTAILAAGPLLLGALALRSAFVSAAGWRTAAMGIASGALAASTMALVCPVDGTLHVLLGHGTMMLVMGLVGAGLFRRVTRI
jgi:hypothetical protein